MNCDVLLTKLESPVWPPLSVFNQSLDSRVPVPAVDPAIRLGHAILVAHDEETNAIEGVDFENLSKCGHAVSEQAARTEWVLFIFGYRLLSSVRSRP